MPRSPRTRTRKLHWRSGPVVAPGIGWLLIALTVAGVTLGDRLATARPPPIPTYDGCVKGDRVRIVTGWKRLIDRQKGPVDLKSLQGKRVRFRGYLLREPTLVLLGAKPAVIGPCRGPGKLPFADRKIWPALKRSTRLAVSEPKAGRGPPMVAVVRALELPLLSGQLRGRSLLSGRFALVSTLSGAWPARFRLVYSASVKKNERAIRRGETVMVIGTRDKRRDHVGAAKIMAVSQSNRKTVRALLSKM